MPDASPSAEVTDQALLDGLGAAVRNIGLARGLVPAGWGLARDVGGVSLAQMLLGQETWNEVKVVSKTNFLSSLFHRRAPAPAETSHHAEKITTPATGTGSDEKSTMTQGTASGAIGAGPVSASMADTHVSAQVSPDPAPAPTPTPAPVSQPAPAPAPPPPSSGSGGTATTPTPSTPTPPAAGAGLVLYVSEDSYQGDAAFSVAVDGKIIGQTYATASHSKGLSQPFPIGVALSDGLHTVTVTFLNDASGSGPGADRNLYLDQATFNGVKIPNSTMQLYSNGSATFAFTLSSQKTASDPVTIPTDNAPTAQAPESADARAIARAKFAQRVRTRVSELLVANDTYPEQIATRSGVPLASFTSVLNDPIETVTLGTLFDVMDALGVPSIDVGAAAKKTS